MSFIFHEDRHTYIERIFHNLLLLDGDHLNIFHLGNCFLSHLVVRRPGLMFDLNLIICVVGVGVIGERSVSQESALGIDVGSWDDVMGA